jgi:hypothetical protein
LSAAELLLVAAAEFRGADRTELAQAVSNTAYLLGVLGQVGTGLGLRPPHQVLAGLQGLRLWSLQLQDLDGPPDQPVTAPVAGVPTASSAAPD